MFFFSSRRRHTRSLRDWSSDVCSSDLCAWVFWTCGAAKQIGKRKRAKTVSAILSDHNYTRDRNIGGTRLLTAKLTTSEIACLLMRFDHVARFIVNANHSIM